MHIPDGFLNTATAVGAWAVSAGGVTYAVRRVSKELQERQVPLIGVTAAFIFAAQMINFPVAGGTSGHLLGGALAAILLGPWAGMLVLTSVLTVQALLFQDGGLLALGANILNMAVIGVLVGWVVYRGLGRVLRKGRSETAISSFAAAWTSVVVAALVAAVELAISGVFRADVALTAMGSVHALIGLGEGLITAAVLSFLGVTRPDLLELGRAAPEGAR
ncbi:MAG: energy-coupling factor ABC transporter permease [Anaerolineae bacterium]|jgi:cobalt/nickel transport system permease protein